MDQATENQLIENLNKCRCCFRIIIHNETNKPVDIDDTIRNQFMCLTQIELLSSEMFSNRICQLCKSDLQAFFDLRKDLLAKQCALYELAGLDITEQSLNEILEEKLEDFEAQQDVIEKLEETGEEIENTIFLEADDYSGSEMIYDDKESEAEDVLKIEKIDQINESAAHEEDGEYILSYFTDSSTGVYKLEHSTLIESDVYETQTCQICKIEVLKDDFNDHIELMHSGENKCEECPLKFDTKILLKRHINENHKNDTKNRKTKKKLHYCPLCSKEYEYKKQLMDHVRSFHKKERNTECPVCKRKFYHRDLKKHIQHVHGEKHISCDICGKSYTCQENLKLHLRYHSEPKYVCELEGCGKKFHQKILFENHLLKHKDERSIACTDCDKTFFTERDLKRHNQRVHTKVTRKCFDCEMTFCRKDKYREHVIKHHKDLSDESRAKILEQIKNLKWHDVKKLDDN